MTVGKIVFDQQSVDTEWPRPIGPHESGLFVSECGLVLIVADQGDKTVVYLDTASRHEDFGNICIQNKARLLNDGRGQERFYPAKLVVSRFLEDKRE